MNGLSKLGIALAVAFSVLVVAILAEIWYVCLRRRKFRQRNRVEDDSERFASTGPVSSHPPSKELLLYYFCWRTQTPIEPEGCPTTRVPPDAPPASDEGYALKWQGMYGPSRFLFTIKEETEREEADSSAEKQTTATTVSLEEECFAFGNSVDDATPFSTPCGSPFYYTPAASPAREVGSGGGSGEDLTDSTAGNDVIVSPVGASEESTTASFVSLEVVYGS